MKFMSVYLPVAKSYIKQWELLLVTQLLNYISYIYRSLVYYTDNYVLF